MKYTSHVVGFVFLGIILFETKVTNCILCLNCKNIADLRTCNDATVCKVNETCYIEKVLSPVNYEPVYNTGCRNIYFCKFEFCNKQAYGDGDSIKRESNNNLTLCSQCCLDDNCNAEGCGYKLPNITKCFDCPEVYEGGPTCTRTVDCDLRLYACSVTKQQWSHHPNAYELGCNYKRIQCEKFVNLTNAQKDDNVKCCDTTLCNINPYDRRNNKTDVAASFKCPGSTIRTTKTTSSSQTITTEQTTTTTTRTKASTTKASTTNAATTKASNAATTKASTTNAATTKASTTNAATTKASTTKASTTNAATTKAAITVLSTCPSRVTQRVPSQYIHRHGDKCFEYNPTLGTWMHARTDCHSKGGHLLSITNAEEQAFISNLISKVYVITKLWLGLNDRVNEEQFIWDTGETVNYTNWAPGRYVDTYHDQEDCVVMLVSRHGKWDDVDCNALISGRLISHNWICQYELETSVRNSTSVDGHWSFWQPWSTCSVTCNVGSRVRTRECNNPAPKNGGNNCIGSKYDTTFCIIKDCPHWMPYYEAAPCSVTCGKGFVQLRRNCSTGNSNDCSGSEYSEKTCNLHDCL